MVVNTHTWTFADCVRNHDVIDTTQQHAGRRRCARRYMGPLGHGQGTNCLRIGFFVFGMLLLLTHGGLRGDEVLVTDQRGNSLNRKGEIVDFKSGILTMKIGARELTVASESIRRIEADWLPEHVQADEAYGQFQYERALERYRSAFRRDTRRWVRRKVLARVVRCQTNTGRIGEACQNFARLAADDPHTHYLEMIPLAWDERPTPSKLVQQMLPWLAESRSTSEQLMAASWLLNSQHQKAAAGRLRSIGRDPWEPRAKLAVSQLWRVELPTMKAARTSWWEQHVESMPVKLRAGCYFLLGRSYDQHGTAAQAALAYLRVPAQYPHEQSLSHAALFRCGEALQSTGRTDEAMRCYLQLEGVEGTYGDRARARMAELNR